VFYGSGFKGSEGSRFKGSVQEVIKSLISAEDWGLRTEQKICLMSDIQNRRIGGSKPIDALRLILQDMNL